MPAARGSSPSYRPEIDGLRALAVVAVILNHLDGRLLPSGYLGVDVFFVISGYVITASLAGRRHAGFRELAAAFYARRVKRLAPALLVCVMGTALVGLLFIPPTDELFAASWKTGAAALFATSNLYLLGLESDYFAPAAHLNLFTQTWSLGVEEQFYLLFPALFWFSGYGPRRKRAARTLLMAAVLLTVASLAAWAHLSETRPQVAFYSMPSRFWELGLGCIVSVVSPERRDASWLVRWRTTAILGLLLACFFLPRGSQELATLLVVGLTVLLVADLRAGTPAHRVLSLRPVVAVGLLSYSLYLWHWSVVVIGRWTIGIDGWTGPFLLASMGVLATASYRYVERPLRYARWSGSRARTIVLGGAASLACAGGLFALGQPLRGALYLGNLLDVSAPHLESSWWRDAEGRYIETCHVPGGFEARLVDECLGAPSEPGQPRILLFGDSHARNYLAAIETAFPEYRVRYLTMGWGCSLLPASLMGEADRGTRCAAYNAAVEAYLDVNLRDGDVVMVGQHWTPSRGRPYFAFIERTAALVNERGARFVLLDDVAPLKGYPQECAALPWRPRIPATCFRSVAEVQRGYAALDAFGFELAKRSPGFAYARLRIGLCEKGVCGATLRGIPIYHDPEHITEAASRLLAPRLRRRIQPFLSGEGRTPRVRSPGPRAGFVERHESGPEVPAPLPAAREGG